ncbi:hypothetical protein [Pseudonocardia pini]|uniref:hypothetical protein n=1 Tax=Pseudonocardia pini TaxID=2758030 RepID=UPI0015F084BE|nr:hypothetical protein [Pseudonocardia pini]
MPTRPPTTTSAAPTQRLPRVPEQVCVPPAEVAARHRIATDPTVAGLPADARLHSEHETGLVFAHGRCLTLVEMARDLGEDDMVALIARRDALPRRRSAAVVVAARMTVGAARRALHAGVRYVDLKALAA